MATVIAMFCFGAFLGTMIAAVVGRWRLPVLLGLEAVLLVGGLVVPYGPFDFPLHAYPVVLALGMQNATLQDEAGRSFALTYVTGAVVRFGTGLANLLLGRAAPSFWIQAPLWGSLSVGAIVGGLLHGRFGEDAFLVPSALAAVLALVTLVLAIVPAGLPYVANAAPPPDAPANAKPVLEVSEV